MKLKTILLLFLMIFCFWANAQNLSEQYFYYYQGEPINLSLDRNYINVLSEDEFLTSSNASLLFQNLNLERTENEQIQDLITLKFISTPTLQEYSNIVYTLKNNSEILLVLPFFERGDVLPIGTSDIFYVKLKAKNDTVLLKNVTELFNVSIIKEVPYMPLWYILSIKNSAFDNSISASNFFYKTGCFADIDPAFMFDFKPSCTNDPNFSALWGLENSANPGIDINACAAWSIARGKGVKVAIIDSGIDRSHNDLVANLDSLSFDTYSGTSPSFFDPFERDDHGTHVCGTVAAVGNNNLQVVGVAHESEVLGISARLNSANTQIAAQLAGGFSWAWQNGADIINNSYHIITSYYTYYRSAIMEEAIINAMTLGRNGRGAVVVFATGNSGYSNIAYPGNFHNDILTVGAINSDGIRWNKSNHGSKLDVVAPGVNILSTSNGDTTISYSGTSMAAPHVSGVAALVLSVNQNLTGQQVRDIIESTTQKINDTLYTYSNTSGRPNGTWNNEMGYGLVDAHAAVLAALEFNCSNGFPTTITQNTIWSIPRLENAVVTIPNGVSLTITDTVRLSPEAKIIVNPGGKLLIDGGTLTNACEEEMWQGITVLGNPMFPPQNQGYVSITNGGKIENAVCGITINGGKIYTSNAHFTNNKISVKMDPIATGHNGSSAAFNRTYFVLDNGYLGNTADFEAHITAQNSGDIVVSGCKFSSIAPQNIGYQNKNNGIKVFNTNLTVEEYCLGAINLNYECGGPIDSTLFSGFSHAILAYNSGTSPLLKVQYAGFDNNIRGVLLNGINYHKLVRNSFKLSQHTAFGAHINNATGYKIEENLFKDNQLTQKISTMGLLVNRSGIAENEVYKNSFLGLTYGQVFCDNNAFTRIPYTGLQTLCNSFYNGQRYDIFVGNEPYGQVANVENSIHFMQGTTLKPAGNKFYDNPSSNITITDYLYSISYHYGSTTPENPPITTNVYKTPTINTNSCPSKVDLIIYIEKGFSAALSQYDTWNDLYEYWLALLAITSEDDEEYEHILQMISYYSALKDNYFNGIIVSIMEEESRKQKAEGGKQSFDYAQLPKTEDDFYENLRFLFNYRNHYVDNLSIVETYLAESNFREAMLAVSNIYEQFELTEEQMNELTGLQTYIYWLQQLENEQKSIYQLSEREIEYLVNFVENHTGRGKVFANNILCGLYGVCIEEAEGRRQKAESDDEMMNIPLQVLEGCPKGGVVERGSLLENITITPNPTTGKLAISPAGGGKGVEQLTINSVEIFDIYGKCHLSLATCHSSLVTLNISHLSAGLYFVKIVTEQGEIVKKVVKQ